MSDEALEAQLVTTRAALDAKVAAVDLLRDEARPLATEIEHLNEERVRRLLQKTGPRDWAFLLHVDAPESRTKHKALAEALASSITPESCNSFGLRRFQRNRVGAAAVLPEGRTRSRLPGADPERFRTVDGNSARPDFAYAAGCSKRRRATVQVHRRVRE